MQKLPVFLSHINEETELAMLVKTLVESSFLDLVDVFVSSDPDSLAYGRKWLDKITENLKACGVELILCSPTSILRPWINFEAGAGWVRDIPVIPLCHSGLTRDHLPIPLSLLQAVNLSSPQDVNGALATIATTLGARTPLVDVSTFVESTTTFETNYTFWSKFESAFAFGASYFKKSPVSQQFLNGQSFELEISEKATADLQRGLGFLTDKRLVQIERSGESTMTPTGLFFGTRFTFNNEYRQLLRIFLERQVQATESNTLG